MGGGRGWRESEADADVADPADRIDRVGARQFPLHEFAVRTRLVRLQAGQEVAPRARQAKVFGDRSAAADTLVTQAVVQRLAARGARVGHEAPLVMEGSV